jgi:hypothetical protein
LVCFVIIEPAVSLPEIGERIFCLLFAARLWCPRGAKVNPKHPHRKKTALGLELIRLTVSWLNEEESLRVITDTSHSCPEVLREFPGAVRMTGKACIPSVILTLCPITRPQGRPRATGI